MIRTQVYLTEEEKKGLEILAEKTGKSQSELIREAIDAKVEGVVAKKRLEVLKAAAGMWADRDDDYTAESIRADWDRDVWNES